MQIIPLAWLEWYRGGDTGTSSETIFEVMTGIPVRHHATPRDAGDFGRCYRLLEHFPEWRPRIHEVAEKFPTWKKLVKDWDMLERFYLDELANNRHGGYLYAAIRNCNQPDFDEANP